VVVTESEIEMIQHPYIYVFNADLAGPSQAPLTNGATYQNLIVNLDSDAPFLVRRIAGLPNLSNNATKWRLYNQNNNFVQSLSLHSVGTQDVLIIPEMLYTMGAQIRFDLFAPVLGNNAFAAGGSVPVYYSQLGFQGVKVFGALQPYITPYRYEERWYSYTQEWEIDWAGRVAPTYVTAEIPRNYSLVIDDGDFELMYVNLQIRLDGETDFIPSDRKMKMGILDMNQNQLMSAPVLDSYLNWGSGLNNSVFPCPGVVYKVGSAIRYNLTSLLVEDEVPATLSVTFAGKWRRAC